MSTSNQTMRICGSSKYLREVMSVLVERYGNITIAELLATSPAGHLTFVDPFMAHEAAELAAMEEDLGLPS